MVSYATFRVAPDVLAAAIVRPRGRDLPGISHFCTECHSALGRERNAAADAPGPRGIDLRPRPLADAGRGTDALRRRRAARVGNAAGVLFHSTGPRNALFSRRFHANSAGDPR